MIITEINPRNGERALTGRVAIVTGSTSGIGLGIARSLASAGANVVLNGFGDATEIEATRVRLASDCGVEAVYHPADMRDPAAIENMVEATREAFGKVDILVNNAGIQHVSPIEDFPTEKWDAILSINLSAAFFATRSVFSEMKSRSWGRIINVASAHALIASPYKAAYVAAKHGLAGLTKVIALEGAGHGVTCNALCPGYVWTPLVERQIDDQAKAHGKSREEVIADVLLSSQPTGAFVTVEQLGAFSVFLASDSAASITGTALPVDGGWTAH